MRAIAFRKCGQAMGRSCKSGITCTRVRLFGRRVVKTFQPPSNAFACTITLSTVKPYFSSTSSPGAEAP